jgi:hypothetical protein
MEAKDVVQCRAALSMCEALVPAPEQKKKLRINGKLYFPKLTTSYSVCSSAMIFHSLSMVSL